VHGLEEILKEALPNVKSKLQLCVMEISSRINNIVAITNLEGKSNESKKAFYLLSLMLLVSMIFLAPDKIPQTFAPAQAETGILEKAQEMIKKLVPNLG